MIQQLLIEVRKAVIVRRQIVRLEMLTRALSCSLIVAILSTHEADCLQAHRQTSALKIRHVETDLAVKLITLWSIASPH